MAAGQLALACTMTPLLAFVVAFVLFRNNHAMAIATSLLGGAVSLAAAALLFIEGPQSQPITMEWFASGDTQIFFGFILDGPSLLMGTIVAFVSFVVQVYSLGYMAQDSGRGRYFAFLSLFAWSMLSFVYAASLLQTFIFWELVGLASFLLIGFWYRKPSAVAAARKAFIMTRVGDVGLFLGVILLLEAGGTLDIVTINSPEMLVTLGPKVELIVALLFVGIVGKSAQFPLHTWLPDAMEGPTPVSALLHSATMVAAGVFLFARFHPLFMAAEDAMGFALMIAAVTTVLASTMAMVATDIKKVLAYSSISQLGYMIMALAAGGLFAGLFHLTTHAIFKALLFLSAGAFIHKVGSNDMVAIGRAGGRQLKTTTLGLVVGGAALAGIPPMAGFFSKEAVLHVLGADGFTAALGAGYLAAFMTAYYTFRMIFLVTRPNDASEASPAEPVDASHAHGDPTSTMRVPIALLSLGAVALGFGADALAGYLGLEAPHASLQEMAPAIGVALSGVAVAWWDFGRSGSAQRGFLRGAPAVERLFVNGWYIDAFYKAVVARGVEAIAVVCHALDVRAIDRTTDDMGQGALASGQAASGLQSGNLSRYIALAAVITGLLVAWVSNA